jgi:hypothetical protein
LKQIVVALLLLLSGGSLIAQNALQRSEVGLSFGGMNYLGDLNDQSMLGRVNMAGGVSLRYCYDSRWSLALGGSYGHIEGGNPDVIRRRNLSFRSSLIEGSLRAEFNFFPYGLVVSSQRRSTPYIFCGIGLFKFNPQAMVVDPATGETEWYDLQPLGTEGQGTAAYPERQKYQLIEVSMPFGFGYRWRLSPSMHLTVEYGWRKTWTDYLDDVSTTYVGAELLNGTSAGSMAAVLADRSGEVEPGYVNGVGIKRGDDALCDWYSYFSVSISFSAEMLFGWMRGKVCEIK